MKNCISRFMHSFSLFIYLFFLRERASQTYLLFSSDTLQEILSDPN